MKKLVLVLCPLLLYVLLAACAGPSTSVFLLSVQPAETPNQILAGAREPSLRVEKQVYSMEDKEIPYLLKNPTGKQLSILMIPKLERQEGMDWTMLECRAGFCGTRIPLRKQWRKVYRWNGFQNFCRGITGRRLNWRQQPELINRTDLIPMNLPYNR